MKLTTAFAMALLVISVAACDNASNQKNVGKSEGSKACQPLDYKNGVYYFSCRDAVFGNALSTFKATRDDLRIVAIAPDAAGTQSIWGYFVITESK